MEKKKVSRFEYAIAESIATRENKPELIEDIEPTTVEEEQKAIREKFEAIAGQIKIK